MFENIEKWLGKDPHERDVKLEWATYGPWVAKARSASRDFVGSGDTVLIAMLNLDHALKQEIAES